MTTRYLTDAAGKGLKVVDTGEFLVPFRQPSTSPEQSKNIFDNIQKFKCRDNDITLLSYPKTGTHWLNEIIMMLLNKSATNESPTGSKVKTMLEFQTQDQVDTVPSPRCLNTHVPFKYLPKELKEKKLRTVMIVRNPKDTLVSYYNQLTGLRNTEYDGEWKDWFQLYMAGEMMYGTYTDYLKSFEKAMEDGIGFPFHVLHYEEMKQNGLEETKKLAKFLGLDVDESLCQQIVDECRFDVMKKKEIIPPERKKAAFNEGYEFFRKGQVGDWKNWFTVAQNEQFDQYWATEMADSKIKFTYTEKQ